jgi:glycosyltransferase involved in cell wall biosynthesis
MAIELERDEATGEGPAPRVSVVMTAYNREPYIGVAIESVLTQTFTDFELVVVDDQSTDGTVEVVQRYLGDPRVRLVINDRNLGQFQNRNHAATLARGEFLKYHDSDDVMYPHCLQVMVEGLCAVPDAAFALSSSRGWPGGPCPMRSTPELSYAREFLGSGMFYGGPSTALFRTAAFHALGGLPLCGVGSDYVFWVRACAQVNVALVSGDLFWYRLHEGQEFASPAALEDYARMNSCAREMLWSDRCPLRGADLENARINWIAAIARLAIRHVLDGRPSAAWRVVRLSGSTPLDWLRYLRRPRRKTQAGTPPGARVSRCARHRATPVGGATMNMTRLPR